MIAARSTSDGVELWPRTQSKQKSTLGNTANALFNLGRYGLRVLVMPPATVLTGMTLPVITGTSAADFLEG